MFLASSFRVLCGVPLNSFSVWHSRCALVQSNSTMQCHAKPQLQRLALRATGLGEKPWFSLVGFVDLNAKLPLKAECKQSRYYTGSIGSLQINWAQRTNHNLVIGNVPIIG